MKPNIRQLGQVFTPDPIVEKMRDLCKNTGSVLEPSCGNGAFSQHFPDCVAIEIEKEFCPFGAMNIDFFDYPLTNTFDTIIGNPPYVKYNEIPTSMRSKMDYEFFDGRSNLYLHFIKKCIDHLNENGELIFIVPRDFSNLTSSVKLNKYMYDRGTITHLYDLGDKRVFPGVTPNVCIFRYEKGDFTRQTMTDSGLKVFDYFNGRLTFTAQQNTLRLGDLFSVKVGGVSGLDHAFINEKGNANFVCSLTRRTRRSRRMIYNAHHPSLDPYKQELLNRKIRQFDETNWWMWGRDFYHSTDKRIYVNCKTRQENPFFLHSCKNYDGSVLALFPKKKDIDFQVAKAMFNSLDWQELGFMCDGRYLFTQRTLENCPLPSSFDIFGV